MSIVEFILARIDEDERIAQTAFLATMPGTESWAVDAMQVWTEHDPKTLVVQHTWPNEAAHIARHDPALVLRQCAALRAIVAPHTRDDWYELEDETTGSCEECSNYCDEPYCRNVVRWPCKPLRTVAAIWSDHSEYREEWAL